MTNTEGGEPEDYVQCRIFAIQFPEEHANAIDRMTRTFELLTASQPTQETLPTCIHSLGNQLSLIFGKLGERFHMAAIGDPRDLPDFPGTIRKLADQRHPLQYLHALRAEHAPLINALANFAFSFRNVEDLTRSTAPLYRCSCDKSNQIVRLMHEAATEGYDNDRLFRDFCSCVFHALIKVAFVDLDPYKLAKLQSRSALKAKDQAYIALAHHLLDNPASVMQASLTWYQKTRSLCIIEFITANFAPISSPIHQMMIRVYFSEASIQPFFELLEMAIMRLKGSIRSVIRNRKYEVNTLDKETECTPAILMAGRLIYFSLAAFDSPYSLPSSVPSHYLKETYDSLCVVLSNCDSMPSFPGSKELATHLTSYLSRTSIQLHHKLTQRGFPNLPPVNPVVQGLFDRQNASQGKDAYFLVLMQFIHEARQQRRCQSLYCVNDPPESKKSYPLCGGCGVFGYCSSACQKESWSSPLHPHKEICKSVGKFTRVWGTSMEAVRERAQEEAAAGGSISTTVVRDYLRRLAVKEGLELDEALELCKKLGPVLKFLTGRFDMKQMLGEVLGMAKE